MTFYDYKIAAGYNNAAGLVNIESITPMGDTRAFAPPQGWSTYNAGQIRIRQRGTDYTAGFATVSWILAVLTPLQFAYLKSTYATRLVTIRTRTGESSYANFNAVLRIPQPSEMRWRLNAWDDVELKFTRMVAL